MYLFEYFLPTYLFPLFIEFINVLLPLNCKTYLFLLFVDAIINALLPLNCKSFKHNLFFATKREEIQFYLFVHVYFKLNIAKFLNFQEKKIFSDLLVNENYYEKDIYRKIEKLVKEEKIQ